MIRIISISEKWCNPTVRSSSNQESWLKIRWIGIIMKYFSHVAKQTKEFLGEIRWLKLRDVLYISVIYTSCIYNRQVCTSFTSQFDFDMRNYKYLFLEYYETFLKPCRKIVALRNFGKGLTSGTIKVDYMWDYQVPSDVALSEEFVRKLWRNLALGKKRFNNSTSFFTSSCSPFLRTILYLHNVTLKRLV